MPDIKEKLVGICEEVMIPYWANIISDHLISNGVTIQRWISVEERLPDGGTYVLVTTDGVVAHAYRHNDRFIAFTAAGVATVGGVTHWMPLPEPPKGE
jgi:hypothetical protein